MAFLRRGLATSEVYKHERGRTGNSRYLRLYHCGKHLLLRLLKTSMCCADQFEIHHPNPAVESLEADIWCFRVKGSRGAACRGIATATSTA